MRLLLAHTTKPNRLRVSLHGIKKCDKISGKGHNETYEIVHPLEHTRVAKTVSVRHVPETGGTRVCNSHFLDEHVNLFSTSAVRKDGLNVSDSSVALPAIANNESASDPQQTQYLSGNACWV
jgi:hypothetical protein